MPRDLERRGRPASLGLAAQLELVRLAQLGLPAVSAVRATRVRKVSLDRRGELDPLDQLDPQASRGILGR